MPACSQESLAGYLSTKHLPSSTNEQYPQKKDIVATEQDSQASLGKIPRTQARPVQHDRDASSRSIHPRNNDNDNAPLLPAPATSSEPPNSPSRNKKSSVQSWRRKLQHAWLMNKGMLMVMLAQFFGASMNVMTRTLELDGSHGEGMHPFQILFARMSITVVFSLLYMLYARVPHPFGIRSIRPLLLLRGISGFLGVFSMYYSLLYLALSEATVLTFLAPIGCCYVCSLTMPNETFTRRQQAAGLTSLLGVVLIARPASLFHGFSVASGTAEADAAAGTVDDAYKRTLGILAALLGVVGTTVAYTSIRMIGKRTHPLVSVTYFSGITTIVSVLGVLLIPAINFRVPGNMTEFLLLAGLGICGFMLQFLVTAGLSYVPPSSAMEDGEKEVGKASFLNAGVDVNVDVDVEQEGVAGEAGEVVRDEEAGTGQRNGEVNKEDSVKPSTHGSKATSMVYTQMLFALFYDKVVFNATPSLVSWAGSGIILASAIYVALVTERRKDGGAGTGAGVGAVEGDEAGNGISRRQPKHTTREWTDDDARLAEPEEGRGLLADSDYDSDYDADRDRDGDGNGHRC
ncbi:hypothetical protein AJ78_03507 [Emergomyces pasteurianus Ep9510]|uniref:EamA domain-containing protein n=1 Tax=Emergomyces pasteurianus Ep9510 TaxID=1447872 RepID=A0A1J9QJD2_9EURO|nr:hypothetical protein AJ78_03507 [Emergomyces pasteurianus Ep9510]